MFSLLRDGHYDCTILNKPTIQYYNVDIIVIFVIHQKKYNKLVSKIQMKDLGSLIKLALSPLHLKCKVTAVKLKDKNAVSKITHTVPMISPFSNMLVSFPHGCFRNEKPLAASVQFKHCHAA